MYREFRGRLSSDVGVMYPSEVGYNALRAAGMSKDDALAGLLQHLQSG